MHNTWRSEINRFNTMEMKELERILRNREILRKTKDAQGRELYTDHLLFAYQEQFEKDFVGCPARLINATEGGAHLRGTEPMTLRDALERHARDPIPPDRFAYRRTTRWYDPSRLKAARDELQRRIEEIRKVGEICDEMIGLLGELKTLTDHPDRFNRRLARVDELRTLMRASDRAYQIITAVDQMAELRRFSADRRISATENKTEAERALTQLERDSEFVKAVRGGVTTVMEILTSAAERFDRAEAGNGKT
jgi:hypothetical protein